MTQWIGPSGEIIDTASVGITQSGTYYLNKVHLDARLPFIFGVRVAAAGNTATVQLFSEVAGVKTDIDTALVPTFAVPVAGANEYTLTGGRGIVVTGISGTIYPEVAQ